jgi:cytochrome P450
MKETYSAYTDFEKELREIINHERPGERKHKNDSILRALVEHRKENSDSRGLDDSEIIGNAFVLLLGGYRESTYRLLTIQAHVFRAKVMMYDVMHLALWKDLQEQLFREIAAVCGDRTLAIQDISKLILPLCVMYETMRLHPVASCLSHLTRGHDELLLNRYPVSRSTSRARLF